MHFDIDGLLLKDAIEHYGKVSQLGVAQEERAEFIQAISKQIRGKGDFDNTVEEIADLLIMIKQAMMILDIPASQVQLRIYDKLDRLNDRIGGTRSGD